MFSSQMGATPKFAVGGQTNSFNHLHAAQMGHASALRLQAARALSGRTTAPVMQPTGGAAGVPGGAPAGSFKAQIAQTTAQRGVPVHIAQVHHAIDTLTHQGHFTPFQGAALKQHNGPLAGPNGQQTMAAITGQLLKNRVGQMPQGMP